MTPTQFRNNIFSKIYLFMQGIDTFFIILQLKPTNYFAKIDTHYIVADVCMAMDT